MKNLIQLLLPFFAFLVVGASCDKQDLPDCVKGRVIGYQSCYNVNVIQVLSGDLNGESIKWNGNEFDNVVQFPGGVLQDSIIYFNYEFFDPDKDEDFGNIICPANIGPLSVPIM